MKEIKRKFLHIALAVVPALYFLLPAAQATLGLIIATSLVVVLDVARLRSRRLRALFLKVFRRLLRPRERGSFLGATYYVVGALICIVAFDRMIAIAALAFLIVGDTAAALIGARFGRPRFWGKSIEGSMACFASCVAIGAWLLDSMWVVGIGALVATLAELLPIPVDDNFRIPLLSGLAMQLVTLAI